MENSLSLVKETELQLNQFVGLRCLIYEDDLNHLRKIKTFFNQFGIQVVLVNKINIAINIIKEQQIDIVFANREEENITELIEFYTKKQPQGLFYIFSKKLKQNLHDKRISGFFPYDLYHMSTLQRINIDLTKRNHHLDHVDATTKILQKYLIFRSDVMKKGLQFLPKIASTKYNVLITGESGTGKELVAHAIHDLSSLKTGPFIAVNCGAIPENLVESELFGHEKGAFTGAINLKKGKFELANNGTIFLDEIGEMPLYIQTKLLRVLEDHNFVRVGGEKSIQIQTRVIAATRVNLEDSIKKKLFREDLFYRLNILRIQLPSLRERKEDIPVLAWYFLQRAFHELNRIPPYPYLSQDALKFLQNQSWSGNVRELRNVMTRVAVYIPENTIEIDAQFFLNQNTPYSAQEATENQHLNHNISINQDGLFIPYGTDLKNAEKQLIEMTLSKAKNQTEAAKLLQMSTRNLRRKLNEWSSIRE